MLSLPRILDLIFSLKTWILRVLNFADQFVSIIVQIFFSKKSQNLNLCECVCVCVDGWVRGYVYVCINVKNISKQCYTCHMRNTIPRINLRNVAKFLKFINWEFKKFATYTTQIFTCLQFCYIFSLIKMYTLK